MHCGPIVMRCIPSTFRLPALHSVCESGLDTYTEVQLGCESPRWKTCLWIVQKIHKAYTVFSALKVLVIYTDFFTYSSHVYPFAVPQVWSTWRVETVWICNRAKSAPCTARVLTILEINWEQDVQLRIWIPTKSSIGFHQRVSARSLYRLPQAIC